MSRPGVEWRCSECAKLLGVELNGEVVVMYRGVTYYTVGAIRTFCRRCGTENHHHGPKRSAA